MEKLNYGGWPNCYRLSNEVIDLIVTTDVGPRIIRFGFVGGDNLLKEYAAMLGKTGGDEFRLYGGHRFWHAPEEIPRTYFPDNSPVKLETLGDGVRLIPSVETTTGIQKEIELRLSPRAAHVQVTHRLRNTNLWAVKLAPWALTVMAPGGKAVIPLPPRGSHAENLQPTSVLVLWAYTDMADPRWTWGTRYIMLRQDPRASAPQKVGVRVLDGWIGYVLNNSLFVKTFTYAPGAEYPDLGASVETFTDSDMLEAETLGPLVSLEPGAAVEHIEDWWLFKDAPLPMTDADVDKNILPKIKAARG
jgi:hypothetical protein